MLRAPRYLIPALPNNALMQHLLGARLNEREALGKVVTARPPKRLQMLSFQLCRSTGQKRQNWYDLAAYTSETIGVTMHGGAYVV